MLNRNKKFLSDKGEVSLINQFLCYLFYFINQLTLLLLYIFYDMYFFKWEQKSIAIIYAKLTRLRRFPVSAEILNLFMHNFIPEKNIPKLNLEETSLFFFFFLS